MRDGGGGFDDSVKEFNCVAMWGRGGEMVVVILGGSVPRSRGAPCSSGCGRIRGGGVIIGRAAGGRWMAIWEV